MTGMIHDMLLDDMLLQMQLASEKKTQKTNFFKPKKKGR